MKPGRIVRTTLALALVGVMLGVLVPGTALASPSATTQAASDITATSAWLNGIVQSDGLPATWHIDYATDAEYTSGGYAHTVSGGFVGIETGALGQSVGVPVPTSVGVQRLQSGLTPSTTYHYRLVVEQNACLRTPLEGSCPIPPETAFGGDVTFTTLAS